MGKVIVLGWDGATWDLLLPLVEKGVMPTLERIMKESAHGPLRSTVPPVTAPSWITIATGVNPGRHGCFDFNKSDGSLAKIRPLQSWDIKVKTFYEILEEKKRPFVLINLPGSYPPLTKSVTLTSLLTQGETAVFPEYLKNEVKALKNYRMFPDTKILKKGDVSKYAKDIYDVEFGRHEALKALWDRDWELLFIVFSGGDWISHELFSRIKEGSAPKEAFDVFRLMDSQLNFVAKKMGSDDSLLIVSDHGFKESKGVFYLNEHLCRKGFLSPDYSNPSPPMSHKMEEGSFKKDDFAKPPEWLLKAARNNDIFRYAVKAFRKLGGKYPLFLRPDALKSRASLLTSEAYGVTIYDKTQFSDGTVESEQLGKLKDNIRTELASLRHDDEKVFSEVLFREEVYSGEFTRFAPHVILGDSDWAFSSAIRTLEKDPFVKYPKGIHSSYGIFLGYGKAFKKATIPERELKVEDITPNILYLLGEAVPKGLDGKVMTRWLDETRLAKNPVAFCEAVPPKREVRDVESEEIQKRLQGLGYMA